jgi:hypothetical protein
MGNNAISCTVEQLLAHFIVGYGDTLAREPE